MGEQQNTHKKYVQRMMKILRRMCDVYLASRSSKDPIQKGKALGTRLLATISKTNLRHLSEWYIKKRKSN